MKNGTRCPARPLTLTLSLADEGEGKRGTEMEKLLLTPIAAAATVPRPRSPGGRCNSRQEGAFELSRSVLVIDGSSDTDAVLRAVLEPRGATVRRTRSHLLSAQSPSPRPDVVVIDLDHAADHAARDWASTPQVVLCSQRVPVNEANSRFLEKPFEFPQLIRAVEDLLSVAPAA